MNPSGTDFLRYHNFEKFNPFENGDQVDQLTHSHVAFSGISFATLSPNFISSLFSPFFFHSCMYFQKPFKFQTLTQVVFVFLSPIYVFKLYFGTRWKKFFASS